MNNYRKELEEILSDIHSKPDWMYLEEFRHQAPYLSKEKFREEIFDYIEAARTEAMGMDMAKYMVIKKGEGDADDFKTMWKDIIIELEDHFSYLKSLPYGSKEAPFMYKAGFEKVLKRMKKIEEDSARGIFPVF
ncbi:MAG: hypothetical protein AB2L14_33770 [Candidatus Xenobiia bacterium LiM19]